MATPMAGRSWRDEINIQDFCKSLREKNTKELSKKHQNESRSLICIYSSDLYIWDESESQIIYCNLKNITNQGQECQDQEETSTANREYSPRKSILDLTKNESYDHSSKYQKLLVSRGVDLGVENLTVNRCGSHIIVWGSKGVKVVELPRRWGRNGMFEGGKEVISCRTITIGERTFSGLGGHSLRIRQVSWHPGSKSDSHIAILTSDNMFSVYNMLEPDEPLSVVNVNTGDVSFALSPNKSFGVSAALGETAAAFDFGLPLTLQPKQRPFQGATGSAPPLEVWPVYCVCGNGDVMIIYSNLSSNRQTKLPVQGPVIMCPPAEDNYGVDACSILCLPTPLPVVIISTCEGKINHCVQLPGPGPAGDQLNQSHQSDVSPLYEPIVEPMFFVIETAELELCLATSGLDDSIMDEDDFMCPVKLKKDPCSNDRYHCSHSAGVHSVAIPWLNLVQQYFQDDNGDFSIPEDLSCIVEHLVCTKPLHSCPLAPVLGMDVVTDLSLGAHLLILSSEYDFTALPIGLQYRMGKSSDFDAGDDDSAASLSRRRSREPFSQHIAQLLQRKTSNPLLKSSSNAEYTQKECFQLLSRATQVLREEYMQRQDHARQEIDTRINILREHKEHQLSDVKQLTEAKLMLRERAHSIAEKVEVAKEEHDRLLQRLESILRRLQSRVPTLSEAEKHMMRELSKLKENMQLYTQNIEQVKTKQEYQERQSSRSSNSSPSVIQTKQLTQIHGVLKEEGDDIQELKNEIRRLSISLS